MKQKYLPIEHEYFEILETEIEKGDVKIIYFAFSVKPELEESKGKVLNIKDIKNEGMHLIFENGDKVRLDRIVVINGIPGPAYDEYDSYALAPLTCKAGYDDSFCS